MKAGGGQADGPGAQLQSLTTGPGAKSPAHVPAGVQPGCSPRASAERPRQEGACLRTKPRGDFTADSAPQTRRLGPPFSGGAAPRTVLTGKVQAWGPESGAGESAKGSRLALKREELSSRRSLLIPSHSLRERKEIGGEKAQSPELALLLGRN